MNVALILFNRPDLTQQVFREIAKAKPSRLLVIADGPRPNRPDDIEKCAAARAVIDQVDWPCEVLKNYSEINLGCGRRPASGISWVFEQVDSAIILEDDCVPEPTFFRFCDELLERYANDERVAQICGNLYYFGQPHGSDSYFFSRFNVCAGGFATWRRAWRHFDMNISDWPELRKTEWLRYAVGDPRVDAWWRPLFDAAFAGKGNVDFWDYQWTFACWAQNSLSIVPNVGLLSNVGFRADGTHTKGPSRWANLPTGEMAFPLRHPHHVFPDANADAFLVKQLKSEAKTPPLKRRILRKAHQVLSLARNITIALFPFIADLF